MSHSQSNSRQFSTVLTTARAFVPRLCVTFCNTLDFYSGEFVSPPNPKTGHRRLSHICNDTISYDIQHPGTKGFLNNAVLRYHNIIPNAYLNVPSVPDMSSFLIPCRFLNPASQPSEKAHSSVSSISAYSSLAFSISMGPEIGSPSERLTMNHSYSATSSWSNFGLRRTRRSVMTLLDSGAEQNFSSSYFCFRMSYSVEDPMQYSFINMLRFSPRSSLSHISIFSFIVKSTFLRFLLAPSMTNDDETQSILLAALVTLPHCHFSEVKPRRVGMT